MPRGKEARKEPQPPFILLDRNVDAGVVTALPGLARFRQIGKDESESRFRHSAKDLEIHQGPRQFLFVTHDRGFLRPERVPGTHGGILVFSCPPKQLADALRRFLEWWGPKRNLLRNRVFLLGAAKGVEVMRDGTTRPIYRQPERTHTSAYGGLTSG